MSGVWGLLFLPKVRRQLSCSHHPPFCPRPSQLGGSSPRDTGSFTHQPLHLLLFQGSCPQHRSHLLYRVSRGVPDAHHMYPWGNRPFLEGGVGGEGWGQSGFPGTRCTALGHLARSRGTGLQSLLLWPCCLPRCRAMTPQGKRCHLPAYVGCRAGTRLTPVSGVHREGVQCHQLPLTSAAQICQNQWTCTAIG